MMNIQHDYNSENGEFYIEEQGQRIAELSYYRSGANRLLIDHTEVAPRLRGQGIAAQLVEQIVHFARQNGLKLVPVCSYARQVLNETADYQDVLG